MSPAPTMTRRRMTHPCLQTRSRVLERTGMQLGSCIHPSCKGTSSYYATESTPSPSCPNRTTTANGHVISPPSRNTRWARHHRTTSSTTNSFPDMEWLLAQCCQYPSHLQWGGRATPADICQGAAHHHHHHLNLNMNVSTSSPTGALCATCVRSKIVYILVYSL